jgi:hypothetical protein
MIKGILSLIVISLLLFGQSCLLSPGPGPTFAINPPSFYGPGIAMYGLANTTLDTNTVSYRFRAAYSGPAPTYHFYVIISHAGYSGGTNGSINVQLETDDGSVSHLPSGTVLGSFLITNAANTQNFPVVTLSPVPSLNQGTLYHLVFTNQDASPTVNYCSIDAMENSVTPAAPAQLTVPDLDWQELYLCSSCGWQVRTGYSPVLEIDYASGQAQGMGYMESWVNTSAVSLTGSNQVREQFTVSGPTRIVNNIYFRVAPGGTGAVTATLAIQGGTTLATGTMTAAPTGAGIGWLTLPMSTQTLASGQSYYVTFSSPAGSFSVWPIRRGVSQAFSTRTYFNDGFAQLNIGSGWVGFADESGNPNQTDDDLQVFIQ